MAARQNISDTPQQAAAGQPVAIQPLIAKSTEPLRPRRVCSGVRQADQKRQTCRSHPECPRSTPCRRSPSSPSGTSPRSVASVSKPGLPTSAAAPSGRTPPRSGVARRRWSARAHARQEVRPIRGGTKPDWSCPRRRPQRRTSWLSSQDPSGSARHALNLERLGIHHIHTRPHHPISFSTTHISCAVPHWRVVCSATHGGTYQSTRPRPAASSARTQRHTGADLERHGGSFHVHVQLHSAIRANVTPLLPLPTSSFLRSSSASSAVTSALPVALKCITNTQQQHTTQELTADQSWLRTAQWDSQGLAALPGCLPQSRAPGTHVKACMHRHEANDTWSNEDRDVTPKHTMHT